MGSCSYCVRRIKRRLWLAVRWMVGLPWRRIVIARVTDHERSDDTDIRAAPEAAYCKVMSCELNLIGYV
jgi:hypothetical protein